MARIPPQMVLFGLLLLPGVGWTQPTPSDSKRATEFATESAAGLKVLQTWYVEETGLWKTTNWWNAANAVTVLADFSKLSDTPDFRPTLANTFERNSQKRFLNEYYDDEGWWALGWAGAYELTHETRYLEMAEQIFADMAGGWDDTCGGGIWWKKPKQYKNAIANELFLAVAARLASLTQDTEKRANYLEWAKREWQWFAASGMINSENLVNDGLDSACHNNHRTTWSYNQGVILAGLAVLSKQSGDAKPLEAAQSIALAAIARLTDLDGVLHDPCEPARCGNDAPQFKGIFVRDLAVLNAAAPVPGFRAFLRKNAEFYATGGARGGKGWETLRQAGERSILGATLGKLWSRFPWCLVPVAESDLGCGDGIHGGECGPVKGPGSTPPERLCSDRQPSRAWQNPKTIRSMPWPTGRSLLLNACTASA
jgi:predicted alpha-1,6-mannanase (GH76 family)